MERSVQELLKLARQVLESERKAKAQSSSPKVGHSAPRPPTPPPNLEGLSLDEMNESLNNALGPDYVKTRQQYQERFGQRPPPEIFRRYPPSAVAARMKEALRTGTPIPGWRKTYTRVSTVFVEEPEEPRDWQSRKPEALPLACDAKQLDATEEAKLEVLLHALEAELELLRMKNGPDNWVGHLEASIDAVATSSTFPEAISKLERIDADAES